MVSYEKSLEILSSHLQAYEKIEKIAITQCLDRILAQNIYAPRNCPEFETAAMDGYAIKFEDQNQTLKILGSVEAGALPFCTVQNGQCVKTFTGSLMSEGTDTLIPLENVEIQDGTILIKEIVKKGFAVRKIAESYSKGELLLTQGTKLGYSELALLAELGFFHISVFIKPIIGILSSGNEIKDLGENLEHPAQIRSCNHIALSNLAQKFGCETRIFPFIHDDVNLAKNALKNALSCCDILVTTGGVSVGDFDCIKMALKEYKLLIDKVDIKPGKHIKIAQVSQKFLVALPGFPYSAIVTFCLYVKEIVSFWLLQKKESLCRAFLEQTYKKKSPHFEFVACNVNFKDGKIVANLEGKKQGSSAIITNLNNKAALMLVPKDSKEVQKGSLVEVFFLP
ncbi:molybdopterin molybdotransferase MoeA [Campylobacter sp. MIT 21-1685]|uniref:molybdopterin molybdotransferase MoeA n=1 Tax=unclassified Campylobacter TaxID=2593542 RepID=UPI00224A9409|nr:MULTISPECIES: molybdopterin molybdotransferase MoeA [unclassified Campylobacter]MCX2683060.1 molybdopterin molybdotransferase MoeA [Campylobacter sp. MIT 21-1684]MCX2751342.1 molybdopterin molybdotransferase MoeA [Campylobacter sp. MIT 21-1682]MCX2807541.1 molybdopterin molybdotransferase MoeA [Campylobacter sp. MIT 21-1685]